LTGQWDFAEQGFTDSYTVMESKDGTFTVQNHKPGNGWNKATGTVTPDGALNIKFDNNVHNTGHMDGSWTNMIWSDGSYWTRHGAKPPPNAGPKIGKEVVLKLNSDIASHGTFFTDSNGREMVKRQRNARGPSYPPYVIGEPVAGNYYPVNSMMSLDDGKTEMTVVTDVSMGGSSMADGSLELMVHRRCQADDSRGVQEPLNETMCGCNDIGADPGKMGAHGSEGDGGCLCEGLTMRGSMWLVVDDVDKAHASRRQLIEQLNFPPTLAFAKEVPVHPTLSGIAGELPSNIKMTTISTNYADWNAGRAILRFAHLYQVDEHPTLSQPVTFSLASIFVKAGLKVTSATETMLTANQPRSQWEAKKKVWDTVEVVDRGVSNAPQDDRRFLDEHDAAMTVTMSAMEVKTFLVSLA
jgi:alpha-mannosidase